MSSVCENRCYECARCNSMKNMRQTEGEWERKMSNQRENFGRAEVITLKYTPPCTTYRNSVEECVNHQTIHATEHWRRWLSCVDSFRKKRRRKAAQKKKHMSASKPKWKLNTKFSMCARSTMRTETSTRKSLNGTLSTFTMEHPQMHTVVSR